ncbi:hypothetical protein PHYSODRAFT_489596 [Phytophthora sojae]|uniref:Uncharacterized protein n=1 Tax=Phytophthora sojae (strain P6497) TaxID=1094619 RepID=G4Z7B5_PHYSP|nr:hypothetical protein PHYSODRAFT_489596 [Phytophthora sojae]EGZ19623.1 hypothetical protein PHYSODRAFT_489596 [Phytophthora sojae]|eukprot:XP_009522340.1 hypothetical protein PHYSODRAFT_489596 [Phytophthora sojae]
MLLTLVLWIDSQLEQYRNAVAVNGVNGTATRNLISSRFTPDNLELHNRSARKDGGNDAFLSRRGCPSIDPNVCDYASRVHFFPAALKEKLKGYICNTFGGINSKYTST